MKHGGCGLERMDESRAKGPCECGAIDILCREREVVYALFIKNM